MNTYYVYSANTNLTGLDDYFPCNLNVRTVLFKGRRFYVIIIIIITCHENFRLVGKICEFNDVTRTQNGRFMEIFEVFT